MKFAFYKYIYQISLETVFDFEYYGLLATAIKQ